ncbi:MAG: T9SS type A sorting domain-containing protein [Bacteroidia bacterium]|nr:T9SS type A sorting domain-containing protein [Bacteroidia bacterium]
MKKRLLLFSLAVFFMTLNSMFAQQVILDFETGGTTTTFQYFGSSLDGQLTGATANPNPSGINTSANVVKFVKPSNAQTWAGAFSNPNPTTPVDGVTYDQVCLNVYMDSLHSVSLKLENSTTGGANWLQTVTPSTAGAWETVCFDLTQTSIEGPFQIAAGHSFATVTVFFGFGTAGNGTDSLVFYMDDVVAQNKEVTCNTIFDFETPATGTTFQYFGSALDGSLTSVVANPNPTAGNGSDTVLMYIKPGDAQVWAGAFSNPNPTSPLNLTNGGEVCVKVHMSHIGSVTMKLENSTTGGANWALTVPNTVVDDWEELCFNADLLSVEAPFAAATGHVYTRITFFIDLGTAGNGIIDTTYIDDFCLKAPNAPANADVTFAVDMNNFTGGFTQPYVSGTFNNWSGDGNPLTDADGDGVWSTTVNIPTGTIEYKFTYDNWAGQEQFNGTEKAGCTVKDPSGQFVNRVALISENTALDTICFNSCYACGEGAMITINLGFGTVTPDSGDVYLAGGSEFGAPGGRFRMNDNDGDGVFSITFERNKGFSGYYSFANGNCPDFSCKEDITGQSCARPENFNDRWLNPVTQDTTIATCYAICSENTDCTTGIKDYDFTEGLFTVAPSRVDHSTQITFSENYPQDRQMKVFSASGQIVFNQIIRGNESTYNLNMSHLSSGMYFIHVQIGTKYEYRKVIRE